MEEAKLIQEIEKLESELQQFEAETEAQCAELVQRARNKAETRLRGREEELSAERQKSAQQRADEAGRYLGERHGLASQEAQGLRQAAEGRKAMAVAAVVGRILD